MAGGMDRRGSGVPLAARVRPGWSPDPAPAVPAGAAAPPEWAECPARHCWVLEPIDGGGRQRPGLLLEWRQAPGGGWEGRVVYAAALRPGAWALVEEWLAAERLTPR